MHYLHKILDFTFVMRNKALAGGNFCYRVKDYLGI
jgi:hypothetical protein